MMQIGAWLAPASARSFYRAGCALSIGFGEHNRLDGFPGGFSPCLLLCYNLIMCADSKILTGLLERRALEAAIGELAEISDPALLAERAASIAQQGNAALPALLAALDTDDPQLRGGLGQVAVHLPREQVVAALRGAARAQDSSPQARLTALTILERFFDEPPDEAVLAGLQNSDEIALGSLGELVRAMTQDPMAILEYLAQLAAQPPDVQRMILSAVPVAPSSPHLITLLRMLAQDSDPRLASDALEQLGRIRTPGAARALTALAATLPPSLAPLATRGVRKLRLSGALPTGDDVADRPWVVPDRRWRVLMSPVDGAGAQFLWFIGHTPEEEQAVVLSVVTEDAHGLTSASGSLNIGLAELPSARPVGNLHHLAVGRRSIPLLLLEAPIEAGRRALQGALERNWESGAPTPLAYRLLNLPIWLAESSGAAAPYMAEPSRETADEADGAGAVDSQDTAGLLDHPAFWGWAWPPDDESIRVAGRGADAERSALVTRLVQSRFTPAIVSSYQRRLRRMAEWLALTGDAPAAALARMAGDQSAVLRPEDAPFFRRLVDIGLQAEFTFTSKSKESS